MLPRRVMLDLCEGIAPREKAPEVYLGLPKSARLLSIQSGAFSAGLVLDSTGFIRNAYRVVVRV
jgi:hypothetical protein